MKLFKYISSIFIKYFFNFYSNICIFKFFILIMFFRYSYEVLGNSNALSKYLTLCLCLNSSTIFVFIRLFFSSPELRLHIFLKQHSPLLNILTFLINHRWRFYFSSLLQARNSFFRMLL